MSAQTENWLPDLESWGSSDSKTQLTFVITQQKVQIMDIFQLWKTQNFTILEFYLCFSEIVELNTS